MNHEDPDKTVRYTPEQLAWAKGKNPHRFGTIKVVITTLLGLFAVLSIPKWLENPQKVVAVQNTLQPTDSVPDPNNDSVDAELGLMRYVLEDRMIRENLVYLAIDPSNQENSLWTIGSSMNMMLDGKPIKWSRWQGMVKVLPSGSRFVLSDSWPRVSSFYIETVHPGDVIWYDTFTHGFSKHSVRAATRNQLIRFGQFRPQLDVPGPCSGNLFGFYCATDHTPDAVAARYGFVKAEPLDYPRDQEYLEGYNTYRYDGNSEGLNALYDRLKTAGANWTQTEGLSFSTSQDDRFNWVTTGEIGNVPSLAVSRGPIRQVMDIRDNPNVPFLIMSRSDSQNVYFLRSTPHISGIGRNIEYILIRLDQLEKSHS